MSNAALLNGKNKNREELEALQIAEDSRQTSWTEPSFMADLFMGKVRTRSVLPYPEQDEEDRRIGDAYLARLDAFLKKEIDPEQVDREGQIPEKAMKGLAELGCFGLKIPKEYGGVGLSQINYARVLALVCAHCASTAALLSAHQSIGVPQPLKLFGTEEQKKKYLPRLARGEISAFALTEPEVGSDPAQMSTTATPTADGNHYILNGTKLWCTNGVIADILVVMAQTPAVVENGREKKQITAFIVEKTMPGFEVLHRCRFMGLNGIQNGLIRFNNVKVPKENIIWGTGKGLRLALVTLNAGRLGIPACTIGTSRALLRGARFWGATRKQWGAPVGKHEAGASKIARLSAELFSMEAITWLAAHWVDAGSHDIRIEAAAAKVYCSERGFRLTDEILQLRGGRGYERESSLKARGEVPFPVERMLRDGRINMIVEGTSEVMRLFVAREALDRHLKIAGDVLNSRLGIVRRLAALVKAGAFYVGWYPWQWLAPLVSWLYWPRHASLGSLGKHLRYTERAAHRLARTLFHLMLLNGPKLEKRQQQLMRIVEIASDLFAMAATIGRASSSKRQTDEFGNVRDVAELFCLEARSRIAANFRALGRNNDAFERRVAGQILESRGEWLEREIGQT